MYRALLQLGCEWCLLSSYRIQCLWKPDSERPGPRGSLPRGGFKNTPGEAFAAGGLRRDGGGSGGQGGTTLAGIGAKAREEGYRVVAGLTLYKVRVRGVCGFW